MRRHLLLALLFTTPTVIATNVKAATYYVDIAATGCSTPSDSTYNVAIRACGSGSDIIYDSIKGAIENSVANNGDIVAIRAGTYGGDIGSAEVTYPSGTSRATALFVQAHNSETVIINGIIRFRGSDVGSPIEYVTFKDLIVDGQDTRQRGLQIVTNGAAHVGAKFIRLDNLEIRNTTKSGLASSCAGIGPGAVCDTFWDILNTDVHDCGTDDGDHGFYISTNENVIDGGFFYNNTGNGGKYYGSPSENVKNNLIKNATAHDNGVAGGPADTWGFLLAGGDNNVGFNLTAYNNFHGIGIWGYHCNDCKIYNSIAYNNDRDGFDIRHRTVLRGGIYNNTAVGNGGNGIHIRLGTDAVVKNNISYNNKGGNFVIDTDAIGTTDENNLKDGSDPLFVNIANNYSLTADSPAIDAGTDLSAVLTDDYAGVSRPKGSAYDIGAYEFQFQLPRPAPPTNLQIVHTPGNEDGTMYTMSHKFGTRQ